MCEHMNFAATVNVVRLTDGDGGPATSYLAEIRIKCAECGVEMEFQRACGRTPYIVQCMTPEGCSDTSPHPMHDIERVQRYRATLARREALLRAIA